MIETPYNESQLKFFRELGNLLQRFDVSIVNGLDDKHLLIVFRKLREAVQVKQITDEAAFDAADGEGDWQ